VPEDLSDREDLLRIAPLAAESAATLCSRNAAGASCAWYHGVWPYFRLLGLVGSPWTHRAFYEDAITPLASAGTCRRVLVSGAADFAMMAVVRQACRSAQDPPEITVVDRCETPLRLHRWYAERHGIKLTATAADIRAFTTDGTPFDLICTHSFFGNIAPSLRPEVISRWRGLLRPGGKLALVNRIRPGLSGARGFSAEQAATFMAKARQAWEEQGRALKLSWPRLRGWAEAYTRRYRTHPVTDYEGFLELFRLHGFFVDSVEIEPSPAGVTSTGPSTAGHAGRAELVFTRQAGIPSPADQRAEARFVPPSSGV
jgi:hypothetical protein